VHVIALGRLAPGLLGGLGRQRRRLRHPGHLGRGRRRRRRGRGWFGRPFPSRAGPDLLARVVRPVAHHGDGVVQRLGVAGFQNVLPRPSALRAREDRRALRGGAEARLARAAEIQRALGRRRLVPELMEIRLVHLDDAAHRRRAHVRPCADVRGGLLRSLRSLVVRGRLL
jgi:hypothetical protein